MHTAFDEEAGVHIQPLCDEAERCWNQELSDSLANVAALSLLSLAYIGHGKDHCVLRYRNEACRMAQRMSLLGVDQDEASVAYQATPDELKSAASYAAWGTFNWMV